MRTRAHRLVAGLALAAAVCLLAGPGGAGEKNKVWKQFLPAEPFQVLVKRAAENAQKALSGSPDEEALKKAQFNGLMIAGYVRSAKEPDTPERGAVRDAGLKLARLAGEKSKVEEARRLAADLAAEKVKAAGTGEKEFNPQAYLKDLADLMEHFKTQKKGGEGIHEKLQSNIPLKGTLNGIEEKLRVLVRRKLTDANMKKEADELALLGYRAAVVGELTYYYPQKKNAKEWQELSLEMRDAGIALAEAAKTRDSEAVLKAGNNLNSSCNRCHSEFRK
jgi:hypothetical protein